MRSTDLDLLLNSDDISVEFSPDKFKVAENERFVQLKAACNDVLCILFHTTRSNEP